MRKRLVGMGLVWMILSVMIPSVGVRAADSDIVPPATIESSGGAAGKTVTITMDEINEKGLPSDISCYSLTPYFFHEPNNYVDGAAANPANFMDKYIRTDTEAKRGEIFYRDAKNKGYLMLHAVNGNQTAKFLLNKQGFNDITGFDKMLVKYKAIQELGRPETGSASYAGNKDYNIGGAKTVFKIALGMAAVGTDKIESAASVNTPKIPSCQTLEEDNWLYAEFDRSQFTSSTSGLDMNGNLKQYTDADGQEHAIQLAFTPNSRYCFLIDEISFIWNETAGDGNLEYTAINFTNSGENINASGLQEGTTTVQASVYNSKATVYHGAAHAVVLYDKRNAGIVCADVHSLDVGSGDTVNIESEVTVPAGEDAANYEIKVLLWDNFKNICPITKQLVFDTNGASTRES